MFGDGDGVEEAGGVNCPTLRLGADGVDRADRQDG